MISVNTGADGARTILANAGRGIVGRVAVHALRATMVILVDTFIVKQAFVVGAGAENTLPILTKFVGLALCVTFAAVRGIAFELIFGETHWFCVRATIGHAVITCVGALSGIAATCPGCFLVRTGGIASPAVIGIVAMDVDAEVLVISRTKRFLLVLARGQDTFPINTAFEFRTRDKTGA